MWMWVLWAAHKLTIRQHQRNSHRRIRHPKVRLPGSGGSQEIAAWANRCYIMTPHQKRRFPEKVEFMTSAGFINGKGDREKAGLRGRGMLGVVTDIGVLEPDETGEMILTALHHGKTVEEAKANTDWD